MQSLATSFSRGHPVVLLRFSSIVVFSQNTTSYKVDWFKIRETHSTKISKTDTALSLQTSNITDNGTLLWPLPSWCTYCQQWDTFMATPFWYTDYQQWDTSTATPFLIHTHYRKYLPSIRNTGKAVRMSTPNCSVQYKPLFQPWHRTFCYVCIHSQRVISVNTSLICTSY